MSSVAAPSPVPTSNKPHNQPIAPAVSSTTQPRARTQGGRKKAAPLIEPDALYRVEPPSAHLAGSKRSAQEKPEAEPRKRKRVEHSGPFHHTQQQGIAANVPSPAVSATSANASVAKQQQQSVVGNPATSRQQQVIGLDTENQSSLALYEYIMYHNLAPAIYPTPLGTDDPPPPIALLDPARMASRAPTPAPLIPALTPANRPRRNKEASRRRSTRLIDEEVRGTPEQTPVLADVAELHNVLAALVQRHFRETSVKEGEALAGFMGAIRARGGRW